MATSWDWITETLQELVNEQEWPQVRGPTKFPLYFASAENVQFQIDTYWMYAVERKSVPEIAEEIQISEKAVRKRIEKIRNFLVLVGGDGVDYLGPQRLLALGKLVSEFEMEQPDAIRALGMDSASARRLLRKSDHVK